MADFFRTVDTTTPGRPSWAEVAAEHERRRQEERAARGMPPREEADALVYAPTAIGAKARFENEMRSPAERLQGSRPSVVADQGLQLPAMQMPEQSPMPAPQPQVPIGQIPPGQNLIASNDPMFPPQAAPSGYQSLLAQLESRGSKYLGQQEEGLKNQQELLKNALNQDAQLDLSPLLALADSWSGSRLAQNYRGPQNPQGTIQALEAAIQKGRNDLSENDIALLKSKLGIEGEMMAAAERSKDRQLAAQRLQVDKQLARADKDRSFAQNVRESLIKTDEAKQAQGITSFLDALNNYEGLVRKHGSKLTGADAAAIQSAYSKLETAYKEAEKLGALAGPDLDILHGAIKGVGGISGYFKSLGTGGARGVLASAEQLRRGATDNFNRAYETLQMAYPEGAGDLLGSYKTRFDKSMAGAPGAKRKIAAGDSEAVQWAQNNLNDPRAARILELNRNP